jgi:hypothetical protein
MVLVHGIEVQILGGKQKIKVRDSGYVKVLYGLPKCIHPSLKRVITKNK